jgi:hypothetical protein
MASPRCCPLSDTAFLLANAYILLLSSFLVPFRFDLYHLPSLPGWRRDCCRIASRDAARLVRDSQQYSGKLLGDSGLNGCRCSGVFIFAVR